MDGSYVCMLGVWRVSHIIHIHTYYTTLHYVCRSRRGSGGGAGKRCSGRKWAAEEDALMTRLVSEVCRGVVGVGGFGFWSSGGACVCDTTGLGIGL